MVISDNGNYIFDCAFGAIKDPNTLEKSINAIPGILECGIFSTLTEKTTVIIGKA